MQRLLGTVTPEERDQIQTIFMRKSSLMELVGSLADRGTPTSNEMYRRIVDDLSGTNQAMLNWWQTTATNHEWKFEPDQNWQVNFTTCELFLISPGRQA